MGKQIVLCVEADCRSATDNIYIKNTIKRFYHFGKDIRLSFVNMNGKTNYMANKVLKEVRQYISDYKNGPTTVIYCIDLDRYDSNPNQAGINSGIEDFLRLNKYELIWFCRDIEEVYLGQSADKSEKTKLALEFAKKEAIRTVDEQKLKRTAVKRGSSNILNVLDKHLVRKEKK